MMVNTRVAYVHDGDHVIVMRTVNRTPSLVVMSSGLLLDKEHVVHQTGISSHLLNFTIEREFPVLIHADGATIQLSTYGGTVYAALCAVGVDARDGDLPSHAYNEIVRPEMELTLLRVRYSTEQMEEDVPFAVQRVPSIHVPEGRIVQTQAGKYGLAVTTVEHKYIENDLVESRVLSNEIVREPISAIVTYGSGGTVATSRSSSTRFSFMIDAVASAYTYGDSGHWGDVTATGKPVQVGYIAVDPRVIPLGSRVYISYPDGRSCYGFAVAEDTGGAIRGARVDLFFETREEAVQFGRRRVKVYVLSD